MFASFWILYTMYRAYKSRLTILDTSHTTQLAIPLGKFLRQFWSYNIYRIRNQNPWTYLKQPYPRGNSLLVSDKLSSLRFTLNASLNTPQVAIPEGKLLICIWQSIRPTIHTWWSLNIPQIAIPPGFILRYRSDLTMYRPTNHNQQSLNIGTSWWQINC